MTAAEKRNAVRDYIFSREGKNRYTQGSRRNQVDRGWSDCSSLQQRAYQEIGIEIGSYTGAQIRNGRWVQLGGTLPNESIMEVGDELFFSADYDNGRAYRVNHIEMYVGNGQISGHGYGVGPIRKNMLDYCMSRNDSGRPFIGVKRYIPDDPIMPSTGLNKTPLWVGKVTARLLNVRTWAGTEYPTIKSWPQLGRDNLIDVCDTLKAKDGTDWYYIRIDGRIYGFVRSSYIVRI